MPPSQGGVGIDLSRPAELAPSVLSAALLSAVRLSRMGWTQQAIADLFDVSKATVSRMLQNSQLGKMQQLLGETWNDQGMV